MSAFVRKIVPFLVRAGFALLVINEIRGLLMTIPVFYALYQSGGTMMAMWLAICSLGGIALSVIVPIIVARRLGAGHLLLPRPALAYSR